MKTSGFSLIEVMVAAGLVALVGAGLLVSTSSSIDAKKHVEEISDRYHIIRQALSRMNRELSQAYISAHRNPNTVIVNTQFLGEKNKVSFVAFGGIARKKDVPASDQREISYFLDDDEKTGKKALMRRERINPGNPIGVEGKAQVLCPDVDQLEFAYWSDPDAAWQDDWKTEGGFSKATLPVRVRIKMRAKTGPDKEESFLTQASIWLKAPISIK